MQVTGEENLPVSRERVWEALNDVEVLQRCISGCESLTRVGGHAYEALCAVTIGPVQANFQSRLTLSDLRPPSSCRIVFEAQGGAAGHAKGEAKLWLETLGPTGARLHFSVVADVDGRIAQVPSRAVDRTAQKMAADFFSAFKVALQERYAVAPPPPEPKRPLGRRFLDWYLGWLGRIFTGKV